MAYSKYPLVTVIICTHHRPVELSRALDSVLAQTFKDIEVLVIHDGPPTQDTKDVGEKYAPLFEKAGVEFEMMSTDEEAKYYCVPRNAAILRARGDYIAHLDDDNTWPSNTLELHVEAIRKGCVWPDFTYGRINYLFEEGAPRTHAGVTLPEGVAPLQEWDDVATKRLGAGPMSNFVDSSSFMAAKGAYWRLQLATDMMFNETLRRFGDWELVTRGVYFAGWRGQHIDAVTLNYYWGTKNQVQLNRSVNEQVEGKRI